MTTKEKDKELLQISGFLGKASGKLTMLEQRETSATKVLAFHIIRGHIASATRELAEVSDYEQRGKTSAA